MDVGGFELLGNVRDESRLLIHRSHGFSIPIPGHPTVAEMPSGLPKYDVLIALTDQAMDLGFRIDELPSGTDPGSLAVSLARAYGASRGEDVPPARPIKVKSMVPAGTVAATTMYPLRDAREETIEQVTVRVRPRSESLLALYQTVRFATASVNAFRWQLFRTVLMSNAHWDPSEPRTSVLPVWPPCNFLEPGVLLTLTSTAQAEAEAKASQLSSITSDEADELTEMLRTFCNTDDPLSHPIASFVVDHGRSQVEMRVRAEIADVLVRNMGQIETTFDLHGWCWQCAWAIEHRRVS